MANLWCCGLDITYFRFHDHAAGHDRATSRSAFRMVEWRLGRHGHSKLHGGIDNLLVDLVVAYIPRPVISRLNLSRNKKNGVIALFATGSM